MRVLLVDHDSEGLEAIARAIRGVLELDCVSSKGDALLLLRQNTYDVLIACERCVDGSGLDLLGRTTRTAAPLKRIFAAAPERLQLLGPRLAPFKVQRTINYPIDLEELWLAIAQVTGGPDDGTDGTIERVVLDERGIPSTGTTPRAPIPPRPPAPLALVPPPPAATAATAAAVSTAASGRYATARVTQPAPEPPLRAPAPPRQPPQVTAPAPPAPSDTGRMRAVATPSPSDTARMRALAQPPPAPATTSDTGRMRALAPPIPAMPPVPAQPAPTNGASAPIDFPAWTPEPIVEDDLASVSEQARFGVQQKAVDEASRRKRTRLLVAGGVALAVAGLIMVLIRTFYDPEARAREQAIIVEKTRMAEQTKLSDNLTRIEIDIEKAIMENNLDAARGHLATLLDRSPNHPRRDFLQDAIDRADELAKLAGKSPAVPVAAPPVAAIPPPRAEESRPETRSRPAERATERTPDRTRPRDAERTASTSSPQTPAQTQRTFGAPIGEQPRQAVIPLNAPINAPPSTTARTADNTFRGRTIEASDSRSAAATSAYVPPSTTAPGASGSATPESPSAQTGSGAVDVTPAKLVKRVAPVAPLGVPSKTAGFVLVRYTIGDNGRVSDIEVVESSPAGAFDDAAQTAVRKWVYEPRKENGVAVASKAQARLVFEAQ